MARTRHFACGPLVFSIGWLVIAESAAAQSPVTQTLLPGLSKASVPVVVLDQPGPDADMPKEEPEAEKEPEAPKSFWETNPPVRIIPRLGIFQMPPTGPGYYSLRDWVTDTWRDKPPKFPYPPSCAIPFSFFDADFRYLDDPKNTQYDFIYDSLHRIHLGDNWLFSTGGEFRWRHMHEVNSRLLGKTNDYDLIRTRVYADLWYTNTFRFYFEFLDAQTFNQDLPRARIDANWTDFLNAFIDVKLWDDCCYPMYLRVGRQELLLGSQRLISPLDWANTRRTFEGARLFRQGEKFDFDAFWARPVIPNPPHVDSWDNNQNFFGLWTTYRPEKGHFIDLYYLYLDNSNRTTTLGLNLAPTGVHTIGTRYTGDRCGFLWDFEGMYQFGERGGQDIVAGAGTAGLGYNWANAPWNPTFWIYYDYASGDRSPNGGNSYSTFNQLFPFGHYYMGWIDDVARQNIHDLNLHLYFYPTKWITVWTQWHNFWLASSRDALYNAAGTPIRRDATGKSGTYVGNEVDLVLNFHLGPHSDIMVGTCKLFAGDFIHRTGPALSPELFFVQYTLRW